MSKNSILSAFLPRFMRFCWLKSEKAPVPWVFGQILAWVFAVLSFLNFVKKSLLWGLVESWPDLEAGIKGILMLAKRHTVLSEGSFQSSYTFSWHPWIPGTLKLDLILSLFKCVESQRQRPQGSLSEVSTFITNRTERCHSNQQFFHQNKTICQTAFSNKQSIMSWCQ